MWRNGFPLPGVVGGKALYTYKIMIGKVATKMVGAALAYNYGNDSETDYEKINGKIFMLARTAVNHSLVMRRLGSIWDAYLRGKRCVALLEPDLFLDEDNQFIPDLAVVCDRKKLRPNGVYGAPDLVIEILSPSTAANDRGAKKDTYERVGVKEYWLVNPTDKSIEVYHLAENRFVLDNVYHAFTDDEWNDLSDKDRANATLSLKVSLYDDFSVDVAEVFADMMTW